MKDVALLAGRVLLALMFVMAGWSKIGGYAGTQGNLTVSLADQSSEYRIPFGIGSGKQR